MPTDYQDHVLAGMWYRDVPSSGINLGEAIVIAFFVMLIVFIWQLFNMGRGPKK